MEKIWKRFSKEKIEQFVQESRSYAQLAEKIGYNKAAKNGSAYRAVHQMIDELSLDTSHFIGQGWNKDNFDYSRFRYGNTMRTSNALDALIALRGRKCECCGLTEWMGKPITLEVHHEDGDGMNNTLKNLKMLCPNCHSMTDNWKGRGIKKKKQDIIDEQQFLSAMKESENIRQALLKLGLSAKGGNYNTAKKIMDKYNITFQSNCMQNMCINCGKKIESTAKRCQKCEGIFRTQEAIQRLPITREELKRLIRTESFSQIGKRFNVSDNMIRKWCGWLKLPRRISEIKKYSNQEWANI